MSRGLEYLTDDDELDDVQKFEKIKHKPKLSSNIDERQSKKREGKMRKQIRKNDKYEL